MIMPTHPTDIGKYLRASGAVHGVVEAGQVTATISSVWTSLIPLP